MICNDCGADFYISEDTTPPFICPKCNAVFYKKSEDTNSAVWVSQMEQSLPPEKSQRFTYEIPSSNELRAFLQKYKLTGSEAATLVGVDSRTIRKWTAAEGTANRRAIPWSAWILLRLLVKSITVDDALNDLKEMKTNVLS